MTRTAATAEEVRSRYPQWQENDEGQGLNRVAPKSAIRHIPVDEENAHPSRVKASTPTPIRTKRTIREHGKTVRPLQADDLQQLYAEAPFGDSQSNVPSSFQGSQKLRPQPSRRRLPNMHIPAQQRFSLRNINWLMIFLGAILLGIILFGLLQGILLVGAWGTDCINDIKYGKPRTSQMDAVTGIDDSKQDPSHITAQNLNGRIVLTVVPGDPTAPIYTYRSSRIQEPGADKVPVTVTLQPGTKKGLFDLVLHYGDSKFIFTNTGKTFSPQEDS